MIEFLSKPLSITSAVVSGYSCKGTDLFPLFQMAKFIIVFIQISVPFGLVIWGSLDWFKALIARDEKEMRMKRKPFVQRVIAALIILVLPWLIQFVSEVFAGESQTANFWTCYSEAKARIDFTEWQKKKGGNGGVIGGSSGAAVNTTPTKKITNVGNSKGGSAANTTPTNTTKTPTTKKKTTKKTSKKSSKKKSSKKKSSTKKSTSKSTGFDGKGFSATSEINDADFNGTLDF